MIVVLAWASIAAAPDGFVKPKESANPLSRAQVANLKVRAVRFDSYVPDTVSGARYADQVQAFREAVTGEVIHRLGATMILAPGIPCFS
ncbi:MAG: hypothetical protein ACR2F8_02650 [Caulobacteraceae bacterium]